MGHDRHLQANCVMNSELASFQSAMPVTTAEPELLPTITTGSPFRVISKDGTATVFMNLSGELNEIMKECNDLIDPNFIPDFDQLAAFLRGDDDMEVAPNHEVNDLPIWQN